MESLPIRAVPVPGRVPDGPALDEARRVYGRDEEIASIQAILGAPSALPRVVEIRGPAGAGKSTIWEAAISSAAQAGHVVLRSRPAESEANLSFAGLRDLIDAHFDDVAPDLPAPQAQALAVALLRRSAERPERPGTVEAAFLRALHVLADRQPVVVAVDDLQWLDRPTRRVLEFAARRLGGAPIAIIATVRTHLADDPGGPPDLGGAVHPGAIHAIELGPLSLGAIHALLRDRVPADLPRSTLRRIHEASRGNPLLAVEIARQLGQKTDVRAIEELPVPEDLRLLIEERLRAIPSRVRRALVLAAALTDPTRHLVRAAGGADLGPAETAGIVRLDGERVRFTHPLFASSVYAGASPDLRSRIHRRLAALAPTIEERARHAALAARGPDATVSADLERAAADAFDRGAADAAVELIARARELTPPAGSSDLHRRSMLLAEYSIRVGDTARAREVAAAAVTAAPAGTPLAEALFYRGRAEMFGADWQTAEDYFGRAASEPGASPAIRARIQLAFAQVRTMSWRSPRDGLERARSAARLAEESGRDDILCEALCLEAKHLVLLGEGDPEPLLRRAEALAPAMVGLWVAQRPLDFVGAIREWQDDLPAARLAWEEICRLSDEHGDENSREWTLWRLAHVEILAGAWPAALRHLEEGRAQSAQAGRHQNEAIYLGMLALLQAHLGDVPGTRDHAARAGGAGAALDPASISVMSLLAGRALGLLELSLGRPAEAVRHLGPVGEAMRASGIVEPGAMRFLADEIEALVELRRVPEAEALLEPLEAVARRLDRPSARAAAGRCRGLLLSDAGAHEAATSVLQAALEQHDRVSMPFERARTLHVLGRVARRAKARRLAREVLGEAERTFAELGASIWTERARLELRRVPGRAASDGGLTPTEARVAQLLAEGRSTAEAAAVMFVTPKTIETYATRIYAKLDVHSRAALAAKLARGPVVKL